MLETGGGCTKNKFFVFIICIVFLFLFSDGAFATQCWVQGQSCDDGNPCTYNDICRRDPISGFFRCRGTPYSCDDGKWCTINECDGEGGCIHTLPPNTMDFGKYCLIGWEGGDTISTTPFSGECYWHNEPNPLNYCQRCASPMMIDWPLFRVWSNSISSQTNCASCPAGGGGCSTCHPERRLSGPPGELGTICIPCHDSCLECDYLTGGCTACKQPKFHYFSGEPGESGTICIPCENSCAECNDFGDCTTCPPGSAIDPEDSKICSLCWPGTFSQGFPELEGYVTSCRLCPAGSISTQYGSTSCSPCSGGYTSYPGSTWCHPCPPGTYAPFQASYLCEPCLVGHMCPGGGAVLFIFKCPAGTYQDEPSQSSCKDCPLGMTSEEGAHSCELMYCDGIEATDSSVCSGRGVCVPGNKCDCIEDWSGDFCNDFTPESTFNFGRGWTLASLPMNSEIWDCSELSDFFDYEIVYQFNKITAKWDACLSDYLGFSNLQFNTSEPFWIKTKSSFEMVTTYPLNQNLIVDIVEGWNLISYPWHQEVEVDVVFDAIEEITHIYDYNVGVWNLWIRDILVNPLTTMRPGRGYWVYSTENFTLVMSNGTGSVN